MIWGLDKTHRLAFPTSSDSQQVQSRSIKFRNSSGLKHVCVLEGCVGGWGALTGLEAGCRQAGRKTGEGWGAPEGTAALTPEHCVSLGNATPRSPWGSCCHSESGEPPAQRRPPRSVGSAWGRTIHPITRQETRVKGGPAPWGAELCLWLQGALNPPVALRNEEEQKLLQKATPNTAFWAYWCWRCLSF